MSLPELSAEIRFGEAAQLQLPAYTKTSLAMVPGTLKGSVDALHDLRVASRRLRAALAVYGSAFAPKTTRALQRSAKTLTSALGPVRDLDVQLGMLETLCPSLPKSGQAGLRRVIRRLKRQRVGARKAMCRQLRRWRGRAFSQALTEALKAPLPTTPLASATAPLTAGWARVCSFESAVQDPARVTELHELRIATKHLRYTLELFAPTLTPERAALVAPLSALQELLGQLHDRDVLLPLLERGLRREKRRKKAGKRAAAGLAQAISQTLSERVGLYEAFLALWSTHRTALSALG